MRDELTGAVLRKGKRVKDPGRRITARDLGLRTTYVSSAQAVDLLEALNPGFFDSAALDGADLRDVTHESMGRVKSNGRPFYKTKRGAEILEARDGSTMATAWLKVLLGRADRKRWAAVPWVEVEDYLENAFEVASEEAAAKGWPLPTYPATRPPVPPLGPAQVRELVPFLEPGRREAVLTRLEAQTLNRIAKRYRKAAKNACAAPTLRRLAEKRAAIIARWSRWPALVPARLCFQGSDGECRFTPLLADVAELEQGCEQEYDPEAVTRLLTKLPTSTDEAELERMAWKRQRRLDSPLPF